MTGGAYRGKTLSTTAHSEESATVGDVRPDKQVPKTRHLRSEEHRRRAPATELRYQAVCTITLPRRGVGRTGPEGATGFRRRPDVPPEGAPSGRLAEAPATTRESVRIIRENVPQGSFRKQPPEGGRRRSAPGFSRSPESDLPAYRTVRVPPSPKIR